MNSNSNSMSVQGEGCGRSSATEEGSGCCHSKPMKWLKNAISNAASSTTEEPLSMETIATIDSHLHEIFFKFPTPDHPPYEEMIYEAVEELNKHGDCSNAASISSYLKSKKYNLPWAHPTILCHHLSEMSFRDDISLAPDGCYTFPNQNHKGHQMFINFNRDDAAEPEILSIKPLLSLTDEELLQWKQPRRRRGRPPKSREEKSVDLKTKMDEKTNHRGHKSGNSQAGLSTEKGENKEENAKVIKKGRGRPPRRRT